VADGSSPYVVVNKRLVIAWWENAIIAELCCWKTTYSGEFNACIIIIIIIIIRYGCVLSQAFLPGTSLEPAVIPTAQTSSFTLQYFPYYYYYYYHHHHHRRRRRRLLYAGYLYLYSSDKLCP